MKLDDLFPREGARRGEKENQAFVEQLVAVDKLGKDGRARLQPANADLTCEFFSTSTTQPNDANAALTWWRRDGRNQIVIKRRHGDRSTRTKPILGSQTQH
jgi:hypothetical protein